MKTQSAIVLTLILVVGGLAALAPTAASVGAGAAVNNKAPAVDSVAVPATVTPTAGSTTAVTATAAVSDNNGANDILSVTIQVLKADNSVYLAAGPATLASATGKSSTWTRSFSMGFSDDPGTYKVVVLATDKQAATADNAAAPQTFTYATLVALNLGASSIDLGAIDPGAASAIKSLGVQNHGNVQIDVQVNGTALTLASPAASLPVGSIKYSKAADMSGAASLSATPTALSAFDLAKGPLSLGTVYWQLAVPDGAAQYVPPGSYTGDLTVSAVAG
jgi:hypothetical protein